MELKRPSKSKGIAERCKPVFDHLIQNWGKDVRVDVGAQFSWKANTAQNRFSESLRYLIDLDKQVTPEERDQYLKLRTAIKFVISGPHTLDIKFKYRVRPGSIVCEEIKNVSITERLNDFLDSSNKMFRVEKSLHDAEDFATIKAFVDANNMMTRDTDQELIIVKNS